MNKKIKKHNYFPIGSSNRFIWPLAKTCLLFFEKIISFFPAKKKLPKYIYSRADKLFLEKSFSKRPRDVKISFAASTLYSSNENHDLEGFFNSLIKYTNNLDNIEVIIAVDKDDDILYYIKLKKKFCDKIKNIRVYISQKKYGYSGLHLYDKFLYKKISDSSKMIADFSDDCKIINQDWDKFLLEIDESIADNIYFVHTINLDIEKYVGPFSDNIPKMLWSFKAISPTSYFPIFSRGVLNVAYECLDELSAKEQLNWSPIANSYICDCYIDLLSQLLQSKTSKTRVFSENIIAINEQKHRAEQVKNTIKFDDDIKLCWGKTGLSPNDLAFIELTKKETISHLQLIASTLVNRTNKV